MSEEPNARIGGSDNEPPQVQLEDVYARLQRDGVAAGVSGDEIRQAVNAAAAEYVGAPVQAFVAVLVERTVRHDLSIPRSL